MFAIPAITAIVLIILFMCVFRQETISFSVVQNDRKSALTLIKRVYQRTTDEVHDLIITEYTEASNSEPKVQPGFKAVLTDPEYRIATWICIYLAISL